MGRWYKVIYADFFLVSNHGFRAILFYCVYVANVSDLFKESIHLVSGLGVFLGFGGGPFPCVCFLIAVFGQNHYKVGCLWERSPAAFPSVPSSRAEPRGTPLYSEQLLSSAALP